MLWEEIKEKMLRYPDQALSEGDGSITYEEAVVLAEKLASGLRGPCYAVLCHSELFAAVAILACLAAGVTAVPLSYRYGEAHLKRILDFLHPPFVLTDRSGKLEAVDTDTGEYEDPEWRPALILCTSGTTGIPKGVMLSEQNLLSNVRDVSSYFRVGQRDTILIIRPLYHCAVLTGEFLLSLWNGLPIRFCSGAFHPADILRQIQRYGVNVLCGTPTLFSTLGSCLREPETIAPLTTLAVSGECLSPATAAKMVRLFPDRQIYHVYGLTEASPRVAYLPPERFEKDGCRIGIPLPSVSMKIVDESGRTLPDGAVGELLVQGPNVMMGYYRAPEITERVLEGGWLHTGDLAVRDAEGLYQIRGRKDDLIIRAGMNIYPVEIEQALKQDPRVENAVAYGVQDDGGPVRIAVKVQGDFSGKKEVWDLCRAVLPEYECPAIVELVADLPRNGSGKVIRRER